MPDREETHCTQRIDGYRKRRGRDADDRAGGERAGARSGPKPRKQQDSSAGERRESRSEMEICGRHEPVHRGPRDERDGKEGDPEASSAPSETKYLGQEPGIGSPASTIWMHALAILLEQITGNGREI